MHLNRVIKAHGLNVIYLAGPGHGAPGIVANTWLEGTYSEVYPHIPRNALGMQRLFKQFSFPGGIPSHAAPETPGSIHEGGELGYALSHAYGAAFDNPDLIVACVVGDGEAETGPLATAWHSNKFLNPATDGAVLPILHLNGYKIANPTILARISPEELKSLFEGYGYKPYFVEGDDPEVMHQLMAATLDKAVAEISAIQTAAREHGSKRPRDLADDRAAKRRKAGPGRRRSTASRPRASGARIRCRFAELATKPDACEAARRVDEELPARGALRRKRRAAVGNRRAGARRRAPHERQSARQRRRCWRARSRSARYRRLRR